MFYLSELIGKKVLDRQGNRVARVRDLVAELPDRSDEQAARPDSQLQKGTEEAQAVPDVPVIKGLVARASRRHQPFYVPIEQVQSLDANGVTLLSARVDLQPFERREGEILLTRDLWDKQIIDVSSRRVTRVSDILITDVSASQHHGAYRWWVRGVDVGIGGVLRRMHLLSMAQPLLGKVMQPSIIDWQHLEVFGSNVPGGVSLSHKKLARLHPVEIARIADSVSYHQGAEIIASLDDTLAADTLEEIAAERQTDIVEQIPEERAADILEEMSPDEATDLLAELSEEKAAHLLEQMDQEEAQEVRQLMRYPEHSAGGIMTTDFVRVLPQMTVEEVIEANKLVLHSADLIYYMYVINSQEEHTLLGVVTVRDLLVHERDAVVSDFMLKDIISVRPGERQHEVARKMAEYNLLALPVVDGRGVLLGVVTVDDALAALLPEGWKKRLPKIFS